MKGEEVSERTCAIITGKQFSTLSLKARTAESKVISENDLPVNGAKLRMNTVIFFLLITGLHFQGNKRRRGTKLVLRKPFSWDFKHCILFYFEPILAVFTCGVGLVVFFGG